MPLPTYTLISEQVLGSASPTVTFSSIPQTYKDLIVEVVAAASGNTDVRLQFNNDTASTNYSATRITGNGTSASSDRLTNRANIDVDNNGFVGTTFDSNQICQIMSYANANVFKTVLSRSNRASSGTDAVVSMWRNTSAITSIIVSNSGGTYSTGSTFRLWGVVG